MPELEHDNREITILHTFYLSAENGTLLELQLLENTTTNVKLLDAESTDEN
jgi:hypothetical protein